MFSRGKEPNLVPGRDLPPIELLERLEGGERYVSNRSHSVNFLFSRSKIDFDEKLIIYMNILYLFTGSQDQIYVLRIFTNLYCLFVGMKILDRDLILLAS